MVWRKPPFTDNEQRNWDLLGDVAEDGGSGGGLTLYGPYLAENENVGSVDAGGGYSFALTSLLNEDGNIVEYPSTDNAHVCCILDAFRNNSPSIVAAVNTPYLSGVWFDAEMTIINPHDSSITIYDQSLSVSFYSTVEFPLAE